MVYQSEVKVNQTPEPMKQAKQMADDESARLSGAAGKLTLAAIGAVALAGDTAKSWIDRFVERGEEVQEKARKRASAMKEKGQQLTGRGKHKMDEALDAADLPSKTDVQSLHNEIAALSAKIDQLSREKSEMAMPPLPKASGKPSIT